MTRRWAYTERATLPLHVEFTKLPTKQRPRWDRRGSHMYTPAATGQAEQAIRAAWVETHGLEWREWRGPVAVEIHVHREVAKSATKKDAGRLVLYKPDVDNTAKLVLDALSGTAWHDDAQVYRLFVTRGVRGQRGMGASINIKVIYIDEREFVG